MDKTFDNWAHLRCHLCTFYDAFSEFKYPYLVPTVAIFGLGRRTIKLQIKMDVFGWWLGVVDH